MQVTISKYYCDLCEKETEPRHFYYVDMSSTEACVFRKEVCRDCYLKIRKFAFDLRKSKEGEKVVY